jgi:hypothetical protein
MSPPRGLYRDGVGRAYPGAQSDTPGGCARYPQRALAGRHPAPLDLDTLGVFESNTFTSKSHTPQSNKSNPITMPEQYSLRTSQYGVRVYMNMVSICSEMYSVYCIYERTLFQINYIYASFYRFLIYICVNRNLIWIDHHDATAIHGAA